MKPLTKLATVVLMYLSLFIMCVFLLSMCCKKHSENKQKRYEIINQDRR